MNETSGTTRNGSGKGSTPPLSRKAAALCLLSVLTLLGGWVYILLQPPAFAETRKEQSPPSPPATPVEVTEVSLASADRQISAVGTLQSNESVVIATEIAGRIEEIDFEEGKTASRDKLLVRLDAASLQAELDRAEASRVLHRANYERAEALLKDKAISTRERDEAYAQWQLDEANVRLARAQLDKATIRAPFSGTLGLRRVSVGDYVKAGQQLVNLEAIDRLKVEFRIPEKFSAQVKDRQKVELESDAYPGRSFIGEVYAVDPQIEKQSRSLVVRGLLDNRERALLPGQFVQVRLSVATRADALFIPEQALITQPKARLVYKVVDGKAQMVAVETGARKKGWVEIVNGLERGDVVITGGHQKIGPGSPVTPMQADPALFAKM